MRTNPETDSSYSTMQMGFAKRVKLARLAAGFATQGALGDAIGMKHSSVSNWERGLQWTPPPDLYRLARTLGVTTDWLISGDDDFLTVETRRRLKSMADSLDGQL
jgi:transcriptional regulator with XRE-family HTH domain